MTNTSEANPGSLSPYKDGITAKPISVVNEQMHKLESQFDFECVTQKKGKVLFTVFKL